MYQRKELVNTAQIDVRGLRAAIYLRKSRADLDDESKGHGDTLSRHRQTLLSLADRLHVAVGKIYPEVVSGETIASRPQMQALLHDLEAGLWDAVLVMEVPRLTRGSQIDQGIIANAFKYTRTLIITPDKIYDPNDSADEDMLDFGMFFSRFEWKAINKRQQAGRRASSQEGKYIGSIAPYGYQRQKLQHEKGWTLVPDPETAPIVQRVFHLLTQDRLPQHAIAMQLNAEGIPAPRGGTWTAATIQRLVRNVHYAGYITSSYRPRIKSMQGGEVTVSRPVNPEVKLFTGRHEPLISPEQFHLASQLLRQNKRPPVPHVHGLNNPLSGLMVCSVCGKRMQRRNMPSGPAQLICTTRGCSTVASNMDEVTSLLLETMRIWLQKFQLSCNRPEDFLPNIGQKRRQLEQLSRKLKKNQAREERAFELVETGVYSAEDFRARRLAIQDERTALLSQQAALQSEIEQGQKLVQQRTQIVPRMQHVLDTFYDADTCLEQNQLLKSILDHVTYTKTIRRTRANNKTDLHVEIFPRFDNTDLP